MNLDRVLFWIRLIAQAILDVLNVLDDDPGDGEESVGDPPPGFKPERIQVWIGIFARAAVEAVEGVGAPPPEPSGAETAGAVRSGFWTTFKPERIQFWLQLIARFVLAVIAGVSEERVSEETGKSGERSGGPAPTGAAASEEADNQG